MYEKSSCSPKKILTKFWATGLVVLVVLSGCVTSGLKTRRDDFNLSTTYYTHGNKLAGASFWSTAYLYLNFDKIVPDDGREPGYFFVVTYSAEDWMFISRGESLQFILDAGRNINLTGDGSSQSRSVTGGRIVESAIYRTTPNMFRMLAGASSVRVRVVGSDRRVERYFDARNFEMLREFIAVHIPTSTATD